MPAFKRPGDTKASQGFSIGMESAHRQAYLAAVSGLFECLKRFVYPVSFPTLHGNGLGSFFYKFCLKSGNKHGVGARSTCMEQAEGPAGQFGCAAQGRKVNGSKGVFCPPAKGKLRPAVVGVQLHYPNAPE